MAIDLPGFGDAADRPGYSVAAMADAVSEAVRAANPQRWILVGHSMGAKVATVVARRAEDGAEGLAGLSRLVLLAGSPPAPEPMDETKRKTMMSWFSADDEASRTEAQSFIDDCVGQPLPKGLNGQAVDDVLRTRRAAWLAWLEGGSLEDWADRVGVLRTPSLDRGRREGRGPRIRGASKPDGPSLRITAPSRHSPAPATSCRWNGRPRWRASSSIMPVTSIRATLLVRVWIPATLR